MRNRGWNLSKRAGSLIYRSLTRSSARHAKLKSIPKQEYRGHGSGGRSQGSSRRIRDMLIGTATVAGVAAYVYEIVKDNVRRPVVVDSILSSTPENGVNILPLEDLTIVENSTTSGRTGGYRVYRENDNEQLEFYFCKQTYNRDDLLKEVFFGALAREVIGHCSPEVFLVEVPYKGSEEKVMLLFISENVGDNEKNYNLEEWAMQYDAGEVVEFSYPNRAGVAIAWDMWSGKSDSKLANLAVVRDQHFCHHQGTVYSIDHESAMAMQPQVLESAEQGLKFIGEFREKSVTDHLVRVQTEGAIDMDDNPHQPIKSNYDLKDKIAPELLRAIDRDIQDGSVECLYQRIALITDRQLNHIFDQYGDFFTPRDRQVLVSDFKKRQRIAGDYVAKKRILAAEEGVIDGYSQEYETVTNRVN